MNAIASLKTVNQDIENDDFQVEYEILSPIDISAVTDKNRREIMLALQDVDKRIDLCEDEIAKLSADIDKLTNHADGLDYAVAVASGTITALIDSFFGDDIKKVTDNFINNKVVDSAKKQKIKESIKKAEKQAQAKGKSLTEKQRKSIINSVTQQFSADEKKTEDDVLRKAIRYMENNHKSPTDNIWKYSSSTITPETHHIDDLAHHASIVGLVASIVTQFTRKGYFVDGSGKTIKLDVMIPVELNPQTGELIGTTISSKIICGTVTWFWHLVSDVAGTSKNPGKGMGIPGPMMSLIKEVSALPGIKETKLPDMANKLFKDIKFDFRSEAAQSIPVLMNQIFVKVFYAIRRFIMEYQEHRNLSEINWRNIIPFGNRTIVRMITIATGTFTAIDMADAAIRSAATSGGNGAAFLTKFVMKINIKGVGVFAISVCQDVGMGIKRGKLVNERIQVMGQQLTLLNAKVYYKCAQLHYAEFDMLIAEQDMWISARDAEQTINAAYMLAEDSVAFVVESVNEINETMKRISTYRTAIEEKNPGLTEEIIRKLKY